MKNIFIKLIQFKQEISFSLTCRIMEAIFHLTELNYFS